MALTKKEVTDHLLAAHKAGVLITNKHDPDDLSMMRPKRRSVVTADIESFLKGGDYRVEHYEDTRPQNTDDLYVLVPNDSSFVAGSGVPPYSNTPDVSHDCLPAPSGCKQGWHIFAEDHSKIQDMVTDNTLKYLGDLI